MKGRGRRPVRAEPPFFLGAGRRLQIRDRGGHVDIPGQELLLLRVHPDSGGRVPRALGSSVLSQMRRVQEPHFPRRNIIRQNQVSPMSTKIKRKPFLYLWLT